MQYRHLFSEGQIGHVTLKNRIVLPPLEVGMANFDGTPSEQLIHYYEERAKNGLGMLITAITRVNDIHGATHPRQLSMSSNRYIRPFSKLVDRIHAHGCKIFCQLHHPGRQNRSIMVGSWPLLQGVGKAWPGFWEVFPKMVPATEWVLDHVWSPAVVAPSAIPCTHVNQKTRALKKIEIKLLVRDFLKAAVRVKKAGADGVEIHAAHGYLIQQFLSSRTNKRTDSYGGSLKNRMRFLVEIIRGVKKQCGLDFPVLVRLAVDEFYRKIDDTDLGIELDEGLKMAQALEKEGIDALDISSGTYETMNYWAEPISFEPGWRKHLAQQVKSAVHIPVLAANLIRTPEQAESQLSDGIQDFVALGRQLLADPEWITKTMEHQETEIKRCISCLYCMESLNANAPEGLPLACTVNPRVGREYETHWLKSTGNKRVVAIIGGGPAGLSAAETLGKKGFKPIVYEKSDRVGGQLQLGNQPPFKEKITWCYTDLLHAAEKQGAQIVLNKAPSIDDLKQLNPHAVIVATGGRPIVPKIKGVDQNHVCTVVEILNGDVALKNKTVAVIGSGMTGLETAEKLAEDGNTLVIVEMADQIGPDAYHQNFEDVMSRLKTYTPELITGHRLIEITADAIRLENVKTQQRESKSVDHIVLAVGIRCQNELVDELTPHFDRLYTIGDARKIGRIVTAIKDGFEVGVQLE